MGKIDKIALVIMKMSPFVSVIMSVYNEPEEWLRESINSILGQTFVDFEFIIVNDNPEREDNRRVLGECVRRDERVIVLHNEKNIGLTRSLNRGLEVARGKYIARMDADDISLPVRFEKQVSFLEEHLDIGVCGANIQFFGSKKGEQKYPEQDEDCFLFQRSPFAHPVVMIRASVLKDNGLLYNPDFRYAQDYELWSRMQEVTCFYNLQEVLLKYRVTDGQITKKNNREQQYYGAIIRRKAFEMFLKEKNVFWVLPQFLKIGDIQIIKKLLRNRMNKKERVAFRDFYYYIYRSLETDSILKVVIYMVCCGDILKMPLQYLLKIIAYHVCKGTYPKLL